MKTKAKLGELWMTLNGNYVIILREQNDRDRSQGVVKVLHCGPIFYNCGYVMANQLFGNRFP